MEVSLKRKSIGRGAAIIGALLAATNAFAQSDSTSSTTTTSSTWYTQWWLWAIGIGVFLIVVIALTNRGGDRKS